MKILLVEEMDLSYVVELVSRKKHALHIRDGIAFDVTGLPGVTSVERAD